MAPTTRSAAARKQPYPRRERKSKKANEVCVHPDEVVPLGNLSNPIHPIFRPGNLHQDLVRTPEAVLSPALRLASHLLLARFNLAFWHTLLFSELRVAKDIIYSSKGFESFEFIEPLSELSDEQEEQTKRALLKYGELVKFRVSRGKSDDGDRAKRSSARTRRLNLDLAMITLDYSEFMDLIKCTKSDDRIGRLWCTVRLAIDLIHEFAHAVCVIERGPAHYFFPGSIASEDGFEMESRLLGGILRLESSSEVSSATNDILLQAWPSQGVVASYISRRSTIGLRLLPQPKLFSAPGDIAELVPISYLERLFDQSFWESEVAVHGRGALRPPTTGWVTLSVDSQLKAELTDTYRRRMEAWEATERSNHSVSGENDPGKSSASRKSG